MTRSLSASGMPSLEEAAGGHSNSYYRAQVSMDDMSDLRNLPKRFRLIPGMEVEAEIKTGRRRIIEYIIYPLIKALDETPAMARTITCYNVSEWAEGGPGLVPTVADGFAYLEAIRDNIVKK